jgi:hypothetical protein
MEKYCSAFIHRWGDHEHPSLKSPELGLVGNGLLLCFRIDDIDAAWERALTLKTTF